MRGEEPTKESVVFDAGSLLEQHRELLVLIELLEGLLSQAATTDAESFRAHVSLSLDRIIRELQAHFEAERRSLAEDFDDDPDLRTAFRELDREHPTILEKFRRASAEVADGRHALPEGVASLLRSAIAHFRDHEEREAVLFASGSPVEARE